MMNKMQIFQSEEFGKVQVREENGKVEFEATGVAKALGYSNPHKAIIDHCKEGGLTKREVIDNLGRKQRKNFIDEGNLYRLIVCSKLPSAEKFESWIFDKVLPSIRQTGGYIAGEENLTDEELVAKAMAVLNKKIELAHQQIEQQKPKVLFADSVQASKNCILVGDLAKLIKQNGYNIGQNRLFEWLRENKYLMKVGSSRNMPTQKSMDLGLFEIKERVVTNADGTSRVTKTPMVTGKGQTYFINLFCHRGE